MLRAMDSGVAGLRSHQNKLDVISNNIANVNTFGFKAQTFSFKDTMYQTSAASSGGKVDAGIESSGGINASQYGYGSLTGSIATDFTSSTPTYIGGFSACVNGAGFFITCSTNLDAKTKTDTTGDKGITIDTSDAKKTSTNLKEKELAYTRVGQFNVDANGYIVDSNGNFVYGFRPDKLSDPEYYGQTTAGTEQTLHALRAPDGPASGSTTIDLTKPTWTGTAIQLKSVEIGNDGSIKGVIEQDGQKTSIIIGKLAIASFQNQEGLTKAGNNTFNAKDGDNTGLVTATVPGGATPTLMAGYVEGSNTDLAKEFSDMITTQRGFQANSKIITVSDEILQELVNMKR
ncbi:flagellar hook-basal body protein [Oribacterium sp. C9]|uniref:flagellar hook-basal body complex protein n=1 Tax=Oribacterium sp. C9 TaxID=1943579 RepID=UPI00098FCA7C|nr:flagellar hook-basal body complex protein [Oribacterium sp. C9]OON86165.1 flagellar hook-basal body protein [Oribacterium sp. C9]